MGEFDSPSEAALSRVKSESLSASPADKAASVVVSIGSKILELAGLAGSATLADLIFLLKGMAANKDEENLIYFGEALVDDIRRLYQLNAEMRQLVDGQLRSKEFHQAVANATLHITRTNVEVRLKRVALLIANGVRSNDLEPENLDDMMRAAIELKDVDIVLLGHLYKHQHHILSQKNLNPTNWFGQIQQAQKQYLESGFLNTNEHLSYRSSYLRLESLGLVQEIASLNNHGGVGDETYALLLEGKKFYERLKEIVAAK